MPECKKYATALYCPNGDECLYQHIDPENKIPPCPHYDQGFCPLGPRCSKKHVRKTLCPFYLAGFCPEGRQCKKGAHPRFHDDLPKPTPKVYRSPEEIEAEKQRIRDEAERQEEADAERGGRPMGRGRRFNNRRRYNN
jgi:cleavage and polyadenylation specificity factor subunit 4